jgi:single-strand DNA-binding protein
MSEGLNKVLLMGALGAEPELRYTQGGQAVLNLRLATNESYFDKKQNKRVERVEWHSVTVWGARGEALGKILGKGSSIFVEGSLRTSSYDDREGNKRHKTEISATNIILAGGKRAQAAEGDGREPELRREQRAPRSAPTEPPADDYEQGAGDDSIPF